MNGNYPGKMMMSQGAINPTLKKAEASRIKGAGAVYYIFTTSNSYTVVAGDDRAEEILAYGDYQLDVNNIPAGLQDMLNQYRDAIEFLQKNPALKVNPTVSPKNTPSLKDASVDPLLTCNWDQEAPYYNQCVINGYQCLTGCPATSAAMVFYYWKYPTEPTPVIPAYECYLSTSYWGGSYVNVDALPSVTFDWDNMLDEKATLEADVIVKAEINKREVELAAEAEAEKIRRKAAGEADAIYAKMEAQARGMQEILQKQAAGFEKIVAAAGGDAKNAMMLMLADKMEDLMKIQVEAIRDLKIDKVTVWDSGNGGAGADGKSSTANFISGLMKSVPPMNEIFEMAGMNLPEFLGKKMDKPEGEEAASVEAGETAKVVSGTDASVSTETPVAEAGASAEEDVQS